MGGSHGDVKAGFQFYPQELGNTSPKMATDHLTRINEGKMTMNTPILRVSYSLEAIDYVDSGAIVHPESLPDTDHGTYILFELCLREVLEITPPTLPTSVPYSCMESIYDYLTSKYSKLRRYERAFGHLQTRCQSALRGTNMFNLRLLRRYRDHTKKQSTLRKMDITGTWIRANREVLAREGEAVVNAIKSERALCFAMSFHHLNGERRLPELPRDIAYRIVTMA